MSDILSNLRKDDQLKKMKVAGNSISSS